MPVGVTGGSVFVRTTRGFLEEREDGCIAPVLISGPWPGPPGAPSAEDTRNWSGCAPWSSRGSFYFYSSKNKYIFIQYSYYLFKTTDILSFFFGLSRDRTCDFLVNSQILCLLSYETTCLYTYMLFSTNQENDQDDQKQQKNHPHPPRYALPERQKRVVVVGGRAVPVSHAVQTDSNPFPQTIQTGIITTIPQRQRHLVATI